MGPRVEIEMIRRMLHEAGYPDADVRESPKLGFQQSQLLISSDVPLAVAWQAFSLLGVIDCGVHGPPCTVHVACWACWPTHGTAVDCAHGRCRHPEGPARPPVEQLRAR